MFQPDRGQGRLEGAVGRPAVFRGAALKADTLVFGAATLVERAIGLVILAVLTKLLSAEEYGIWAQMVVASATVSTVLLLGFNATLVRFLAGAKDRSEASNVFHGMLAAVLVGSLVFMAAAVVLARPFSAVVFGSDTFVRFARVLAVLILAETLFEFTAAFFRARRQIRLASGYYVLKAAVRLLVFVAALIIWDTGLYTSVLLVLAAQAGLMGFFYVVHVGGDVGWRLQLWGLPWRQMFALSLPFVPYYALVAINGFVGRYFLVQFGGLRDAAIYAVVYSLAAVIGLVYSVLGFTLYPHFATLWSEDGAPAAAHTLRRFTEVYLFLAAPCVVALTVFGRPLIAMVATDAYVSGWPVRLLLGAAMLVFGLYQLHIYMTIVAGRSLANLGILVTAFVLNVVLNRLLVPAAGIVGTAAAALAVNTVLAWWTIVVGKHDLPYSFPWSAAGRVALGSAIMAGVGLAGLMRWRGEGLLAVLAMLAVSTTAFLAVDVISRRSLLRELW